jgi:hypothetical protein
MKIRTLALALMLGFALTGVSEAAKRKAKPVYSSKGQVARKANRAKFKATKRKITKLQVKRPKRK